jgi:hypothetical protein
MRNNVKTNEIDHGALEIFAERRALGELKYTSPLEERERRQMAYLGSRSRRRKTVGPGRRRSQRYHQENCPK